MNITLNGISGRLTAGQAQQAVEDHAGDVSGWGIPGNGSHQLINFGQGQGRQFMHLLCVGNLTKSMNGSLRGVNAPFTVVHKTLPLRMISSGTTTWCVLIMPNLLFTVNL
jgi:hypothetical protein